MASNGHPHQHGCSVKALRQELETWWAAISHNHTDVTGSYTALHVFPSVETLSRALSMLYYRRSRGRGTLAPQQCDSKARKELFRVRSEHARDVCEIYRDLYQVQEPHIPFTWASLPVLFLGGVTLAFIILLCVTVRAAGKMRYTD